MSLKIPTGNAVAIHEEHFDSLTYAIANTLASLSKTRSPSDIESVSIHAVKIKNTEYCWSVTAYAHIED